MITTSILFYVLLPLAAALTVITGKLRVSAAFVAVVLSIVIYEGTGIAGIALMAAFFMLGVGVTSWKASSKEKFGASGQNQETRNSQQVLANGGVAALLAFYPLITGNEYPVFLVMIAGAFSSATADTVSSELGVLYGKRCYNIVTLSPDTRGENGVVSVEGTLLGFAGSVLIAAIHSLFTEWSPVAFCVIIAAGTVGNLADSILGALLERKHILGNNAVNFLNTFIAAAIAGALIIISPG